MAALATPPPRQTAHEVLSGATVVQNLMLHCALPTLAGDVCSVEGVWHPPLTTEITQDSCEMRRRLNLNSYQLVQSVFVPALRMLHNAFLFSAEQPPLWHQDFGGAPLEAAAVTAQIV